MTKELIRCERITKSYAMGEVTVNALQGLDLAIAEGSFVVILGPSGCGKTTTLNLIGGLDRPTAGTLRVAGEEVSSMSEARLTRYRRERVGFVFQFFNLIPTLTAAENVELVLALSPASNGAGKSRGRDRARELLGLVGLANRADHFPAQLSGGEQQRVSIARALANEPSVLLCDEPTGNLDVETGVNVLGVIRNLNRTRGATVVLVTHNAAIAAISDRIVRLRNGAVEEDRVVADPVDASRITW